MRNSTPKTGPRDSATGLQNSEPGDSKDSTQASNILTLAKVRAACFVFVFALALLVYIRTLAPTVTLVDSGELIVAARWLGVAHPPGFPLYVLMAHLATLFPFGNVAQRVNFASAVFAAAAAGLVVLLVAEAMITPPAEPRKRSVAKTAGRKRRRAPKTVAQEDPRRRTSVIVSICPPILAGLTLAFSRTLWAYGTITEVYTLNTLLIVSIFLLMMIWRRWIYNARTQRGVVRSAAVPEKGLAARNQARIHPDLWLYCAAFIFGLALGVHHVTVGLTLPALGAFVLTTEGWGFFRSTRLLRAAIISISGLGIYIYLPLAAARSPVLNWGNPSSPGRIWDHITGKQYRVFLKFAGDEVGRLLLEFFRLAGREFGPPILPLVFLISICGFVVLWRQRERAVFYLLVLTISADLAYGLSYEIAEDKDAYYLPAFIAISIGVGFGVKWLFDGLYNWRITGGSEVLAGALCVAVMGLSVVVELMGNYSYNNRSHFYVAHDYVDNILSTVPQGAMLMTQDWQVYSPLMYVREVERQRRDVVAVDAQLLRRLWYYDYLRKEYPEMIAQTRPQVDAFLDDLSAWDKDPQLYDSDVTLNRRINTRFTDMMLAFVSYQMRNGGVYLTEDLAPNLAGDMNDFTKALGKDYQYVPQGLVFQLEGDRSFHTPANPQWQVRGLFDGSLSFDPDDVVEQKVAPAYLNMLVNRGRYFAANAHPELSIEAYDQALKLRPDFPAARKSLAEVQHSSGN